MGWEIEGIVTYNGNNKTYNLLSMKLGISTNRDCKKYNLFNSVQKYQFNRSQFKVTRLGALKSRPSISWGWLVMDLDQLNSQTRLPKIYWLPPFLLLPLLHAHSSLSCIYTVRLILWHLPLHWWVEQVSKTLSIECQISESVLLLSCLLDMKYANLPRKFACLNYFQTFKFCVLLISSDGHSHYYGST